MIIKNKTEYKQKVYNKDGSVVACNPYRTIEVDESIVNELDTKIWDVPVVEKVTKKSVTTGGDK